MTETEQQELQEDFKTLHNYVKELKNDLDEKTRALLIARLEIEHLSSLINDIMEQKNALKRMMRAKTAETGALRDELIKFIAKIEQTKI